MSEKAGPYDDILNLPRHVSNRHPHMAAAERAAQFSPFAALTGYGDVIRETGRLTGRRIDLDEEARARLDQKLHQLTDGDAAGSPVSITYFLPDDRKEGGVYVTATGTIRRIDDVRRTIILTDGSVISAEDVLEITEVTS